MNSENAKSLLGLIDALMRSSNMGLSELSVDQSDAITTLVKKSKQPGIPVIINFEPNKKLHAIRSFRAITNSGLKEAKEAIESYRIIDLSSFGLDIEKATTMLDDGVWLRPFKR
jgi:hypothetical protein